MQISCRLLHICAKRFHERDNQSGEENRQRLETASRQKSYADKRQTPLEFQVGDAMFLKVTPLKSVMQFIKKENLSRRYVGPFEIVQRIEKVAYKLALSHEL